MSFDDFVVFIFLTTIANLLDEFRIVRFNFNFQIKAWHSTKNSNITLIAASINILLSFDEFFFNLGRILTLYNSYLQGSMTVCLQKNMLNCRVNNYNVVI